MTLPTFLAWEAVQEAHEGNHVLILAKRSSNMLTCLLNNSGKELARTICRANGNESISFGSGGTISIYRQAEGLIGSAAKLVIIPIGTPDNDMANIIPCINGVNGGAIVGYY